MHKNHLLITAFTLAVLSGTAFGSKNPLHSLLEKVEAYNDDEDAYKETISLRKELCLRPVYSSRTSNKFTYYVYHSENISLTPKYFYRKNLDELASLFKEIFEQRKIEGKLLEPTQKEYDYFRYSPLAHWYFVGSGSNKQSEMARSYEEWFLNLGKNKQ